MPGTLNLTGAFPHSGKGSNMMPKLDIAIWFNIGTSTCIGQIQRMLCSLRIQVLTGKTCSIYGGEIYKKVYLDLILVMIKRSARYSTTY